MTSSLKPLAFLVVMSLTLSSCDLFDKVDDITFEGVLPLEFVVNETDHSDVPKSYSSTKILDALDNDEINKYKNKIKEIKLESVTYEIRNYHAPDQVTFSEGFLKAGASQKNLAAVPVVALENIPETELASLDLEGVNELVNELNADREVEVNMQGVLSTTPVAFTVVVKFHVRVTAEVLK